MLLACANAHDDINQGFMPKYAFNFFMDDRYMNIVFKNIPGINGMKIIEQYDFPDAAQSALRFI